MELADFDIDFADASNFLGLLSRLKELAQQIEDTAIIAGSESLRGDLGVLRQRRRSVSKIPCAKLDKAFRSLPEKPALILPPPPGKTLGIESRKRVHRLLPARAGAFPVGGDVAQGQPDQLAGRIVVRKMPTGLDDPA
jgi:hypothetical protein